MTSSVFEGDVKKNLLERTEAEKVFRPWWDTLEDYLLNILIVLGQSVTPCKGLTLKNLFDLALSTRRFCRGFNLSEKCSERKNYFHSTLIEKGCLTFYIF